MGNFASLATGVLGGVVAGKQAMDRKERDKKWDETMAPIYKKLAGVDDKATPPGATPKDPAAPVAPVAAAETEDKMANGGMVGGSMPMHHDRMSWQRQSFKK